MEEKNLIIFTDCGDTLVDESTQVWAENGDVFRADMVEGAREALLSLYEAGYRIALVADGRIASFRNIFRESGLTHVFEAWVISEELGEEKPSPLMFRTAMARMGLSGKDLGRIVMVGNNLKRDVLGANRMGIRSILLSFSPRYDMRPDTPEEQPDHTIAMPGELPGLVEELELALKRREQELALKRNEPELALKREEPEPRHVHQVQAEPVGFAPKREG